MAPPSHRGGGAATPMSERDLPSRGQPEKPEDVTYRDPLPDAEPGIEDPEADFVEQRLGESDDEAEEPPADEPVPLEAPEADVMEQRRTTPGLDENGDRSDEHR